MSQPDALSRVATVLQARRNEIAMTYLHDLRATLPRYGALPLGVMKPAVEISTDTILNSLGHRNPAIFAREFDQILRNRLQAGLTLADQTAATKVITRILKATVSTAFADDPAARDEGLRFIKKYARLADNIMARVNLSLTNGTPAAEPPN